VQQTEVSDSHASYPISLAGRALLGTLNRWTPTTVKSKQATGPATRTLFA